MNFQEWCNIIVRKQNDSCLRVVDKKTIKQTPAAVTLKRNPSQRSTKSLQKADSINGDIEDGMNLCLLVAYEVMKQKN